MTHLLQNWKLDIANLPKYKDFNDLWEVIIDLPLALIILVCIDCDDQGIPLILEESRNEFRQLVKCAEKNNGIVRAKYSARAGGIGSLKKKKNK